MRRAQGLFSHFLLRRALLRSSFAIAASRDPETLIGAALYGTAATAPSRSFSSAAASASASRNSKSISLGVVGALSLSLSFLIEVEAKDRSSPELTPQEVVLYQYEACPFCNKVKAFLDYHDIPYNVVEVNPLSKKEIKWSEYKKVPILVVDGETLVNSSDIVETLSHKFYPDSSINDDEEKKWCRWVDDHLVHMLSPNIYRSTSEALESFNYIANNGNFSRFERFTVKYAGAAAMYMVSKKLKKKHNITDERAALYEAAETWTDALGGRDFLGGEKPNLADLAVFGVLRPIRYLKAGKDMVENTHIGEWYQRMENAVGESSRIKA